MTVTDSPTSKSTSIGTAAATDTSAEPRDDAAFFGSVRGTRNFSTSSSVSGDGFDVRPTKPVTPGCCAPRPTTRR